MLGSESRLPWNPPRGKSLAANFRSALENSRYPTIADTVLRSTLISYRSRSMAPRVVDEVMETLGRCAELEESKEKRVGRNVVETFLLE
jgi:hypothetical protein